jgi:HAD superfamily hydrolase (TIGR01509 family)
VRVGAVLFDLFDTLLLLENSESYYEACIREMYRFLARKGINVSFDEFRRVYFDIRDESYSESRESLEEPHFNVRVAQTLSKLGYNFEASNPIVVGATESFAEEFTHHVRPDRDAHRVLQKLHRKCRLGLISNFAIPECGRRLLKMFGLKEYFDLIIINAEVNLRKPSPKIFNVALQELGVDASNTVFVGDMVDLDIAGPQSVGMKTVLINRRPSWKTTRAKPDAVINSLVELLDVIEDC